MKVLALDDEKIALSVLENAIRGAIPEAEVISCRSPEKALTFLQENFVDVIFCDYKMPGIGGIDFGVKVKKIWPLTDIIFVTGFSEYAIEAVNKLAPQGYLVKPVSKDKIRAVLKNLHQNDEKRGIYIKAFGSFELFHEGDPVEFKVRKAKELLAYLVDRGGATCTRRELLAVLYEEKDEKNAQRYFADALKCLQDVLVEINAENMLVRKFNSYAVDKTYFQSDLEEYEKGNSNLFQGEYMTQYSWGEYKISQFL